MKIAADAKREHEYDVAISLATFVTSCFNGKFDPTNANPIRSQHVEELQRTQGDSTGKEAFAMLEAGLKMFV